MASYHRRDGRCSVCDCKGESGWSITIFELCFPCLTTLQIHEVGENNLVNEHVREDPNMAADKEYDIKKAVASMAGGTDTVRWF